MLIEILGQAKTNFSYSGFTLEEMARQVLTHDDDLIKLNMEPYSVLFVGVRRERDVYPLLGLREDGTVEWTRYSLKVTR